MTGTPELIGWRKLGLELSGCPGATRERQIGKTGSWRAGELVTEHVASNIRCCFGEYLYWQDGAGCTGLQDGQG